MLFVEDNFLNLDVKKIEHDNIVMENKSGIGGGKHLMLDIWDSREDDEKDQQNLKPFVDPMMVYFRKKMPHIKIKNYRIEHRVYEMDKDETFTGRVHDDSCEYSMVLYYRIDENIQGGVLHFYDDDGKIITNSYHPKVRSLVIFNGVHSVGKLSASKLSRRSIIIIQINSED